MPRGFATVAAGEVRGGWRAGVQSVLGSPSIWAALVGGVLSGGVKKTPVILVLGKWGPLDGLNSKT